LAEALSLLGKQLLPAGFLYSIVDNGTKPATFNSTNVHINTGMAQAENSVMLGTGPS
jgi:hypothetical protein